MPLSCLCAATAAVVTTAGRCRRRVQARARVNSRSFETQDRYLSQSRKISSPGKFQHLVDEILSGQIDPLVSHGACTGWQEIDNLYRVVPGEVTIVTGIPGSGKSEFVLSLLCNLAEVYDWKFGLTCFEIEEDRLMHRLLQKHQKTATPKHRNESWNWIQNHFKLMTGIRFKSRTIQQILNDAEKLVTAHSIKGLVIDPYNWIKLDIDNQLETQIVSQMMTELRRFAIKHMCHIWLVAHPGKQAKSVGVNLSLYDIAGSANFNNKCDMGITVFRYKQAQKARKGEVAISAVKVRNRQAGQLGRAALYFNAETRGYTDCPYGVKLGAAAGQVGF